MHNGCTCYLVVTDQERVEEYSLVFGPEGHIPIESPVPRPTALRDKGMKDAYFVALGRLAPDQLRLLKERISIQFQFPYNAVDEQLSKRGLPIRAENTVVTWCPVHSKAAV